MKKRIIKLATCVVLLGATSSMLMAAKAADIYGKCVAAGQNECMGEPVGNGSTQIWCSPAQDRRCQGIIPN